MGVSRSRRSEPGRRTQAAELSPPSLARRPDAGDRRHREDLRDGRAFHGQARRACGGQAGRAARRRSQPCRGARAQPPTPRARERLGRRRRGCRGCRDPACGERRRSRRHGAACLGRTVRAPGRHRGRRWWHGRRHGRPRHGAGLELPELSDALAARLSRDRADGDHRATWSTSLVRRAGLPELERVTTAVLEVGRGRRRRPHRDSAATAR